MTNEEFEATYYPKYKSVIRAIARKLAMTNDALVEDLYQEGLVALWNCQPRLARDNPDAFIRQSVKFRMIDFLRKEKLSSTESLDARMEVGEEIVERAPGELALVMNYTRGRVAVPRRVAERDDDGVEGE
jgi:DNA-directed RNA polymerase specialized sigma24 family protein